MKFKKNKALGLLLFFYLGTSYAQSVGTTEGVFNVSDMGAANYSISIKVPDGIGGLQPSLFLNYSSQGGNCPLGMGWSIGGLSVITRTGNNIYHEIRPGPILKSLREMWLLL